MAQGEQLYQVVQEALGVLEVQVVLVRPSFRHSRPFQDCLNILQVLGALEVQVAQRDQEVAVVVVGLGMEEGACRWRRLEVDSTSLHLKRYNGS